MTTDADFSLTVYDSGDGAAGDSRAEDYDVHHGGGCMTFTTEKIVRVYDDNEGVYLQVHQSPDCPGTALEISTAGDKASEQWYGKQRLMLSSKAHAIALAHAILEMAETIK